MNRKDTMLTIAAIVCLISGCTDRNDDFQHRVSSEDTVEADSASDRGTTVLFEGLDIDKSDYLTRKEFCGRENWNGLFGNWDANNNGLLDRKEFSYGLFDRWDQDNSGIIEKTEWSQVRYWFEDSFRYGEWNTDTAQGLTPIEFWSAVRENDILSEGLDESQFCRQLFSRYDTDTDNQISINEWKKAHGREIP